MIRATLRPLLLTPAALVRRHLVAPVARLSGHELTSPLAGRLVLVTGASSGVGEASAREIARRGARVLLVARRADALAKIVAEINDEAGRVVAHGHACDLTDEDATAELVATVLAEHGTVDMLVNNAGRSIRRSLAYSYDRPHDFERTMAINYFGPVRLTLGLLPAMREQHFGHVVNVVTWGVQLKAPKFAAYIASKSALDTFARIAGRESWFDNVTFTNLRLSLVRTDMISATEAYQKMPALSAEDAAALVVRALEDRPLTISTSAGVAGEWFNLLTPRAMDLLLAVLDKRMPDSRAARGLPPRSQPRRSAQGRSEGA